MKMSIDWHKNCLKNNKSSIEKMIEERNRLNARIEESETVVNFYEFQISVAENSGKDGFDKDLFQKKERSRFIKVD